MRRLFLLLTVVVIMAMVAPAALADEPKSPADQPIMGYAAWEPLWWADNFDAKWTILGTVQEYAFWVTQPPNPVTGIRYLAPNHPVDVYLWRPSTIDDAGNVIWPLTGVTPGASDWWTAEYSSMFRRQSWPKYATTNAIGFYYAKFMLPRDEVWYPCGYPCNWKCDNWDPITGLLEAHAPYWIETVYRLPLLSNPDSLFWPYYYPLYWPNLGYFGELWPTADWWQWSGDTVHPLTAWPADGEFLSLMAFCDAIDPDPLVIGDEYYDCDVDGDLEDFDNLAYYQYGIEGYYWKTTDLKMEWPNGWPYICEWQ